MSAARRAYWEAHPDREEFKEKISQTKRARAQYPGIRRGYMIIGVPGRGLMAAHRFIMEQMLGRELLESEVVHHRDGNRLNNAPDNLELVSASEHSSHHHAGRARDDLGRYI